MTLDVLKDWEDVLGFDPTDFEDVVRDVNANIDKKPWFVTRFGKLFAVPHHRTKNFSPDTAALIRFYALKARAGWLNMKERSEGKLREFIADLCTALHIAQDFCAWSLPANQHEDFENRVDEIYKPLRKKFRAKRSKIYNTYWTLTEGEFSTTNDPKKYVKEAYRRSSELVSFVVSERKMVRGWAENLFRKYGEFFPESLDEYKYWKIFYPFFRIGCAVLLGYFGIQYLLKSFNSSVCLFTFIVYFAVSILIYIASKLAEFKHSGKRYDILPDAAEMVVGYYLRKYFNVRPQVDERTKLLRQDYYIQ